MSKNDDKKQPSEAEVLVNLTHDAFMRNISIHIHMDRPMRPEEFIAELADVVAEFQENPEQLFEAGELVDPQ